MLKPNPRRFFRFTCNGKYSHKDLDRYSSYVDTTSGLGPKGDCWEWRGSLDNKGYGRLGITKNNKYKTYLVHRVAYETTTNRLVSGDKCVCHHCDNPKCVKSYVHLFLGTRGENNKDRDNKGRCVNLTGENHGMAKTNWKEVGEIRHKYNYENHTLYKLADIYNIHHSSILYIVQNKIWYDPNYIPSKSKLGKNGTTKLNQEQADKIRMEHSTGEYTQQQLADKFNISRPTISDIINNRTWNTTG